MTDNFIEERYTNGLKPDFVKEGRALCMNMFNTLGSDPHVSRQLEQLNLLSPTTSSHSFLVSFFSMLICKHLDWVSSRTIESVVMGAFLHDIGLLQLNKELLEKKYESMTESEKKIYEQHPRLGYEMLSKSSAVNEQIRQIVLQHHEQVSSLGYPFRLSGVRIYPPAKIVALADAFVEIIVAQNLTPINALKHLLIHKEIIMNYDGEIVRALVSGFRSK